MLSTSNIAASFVISFATVSALDSGVRGSIGLLVISLLCGIAGWVFYYKTLRENNV